MRPPDPQSPTEALDLQTKIADTMAGTRPIDAKYPYFPPDYDIPFLHIGTQRQLFLDNFILDHLQAVERVLPTPTRPAEPLIKTGDLPWERGSTLFTAAALHDPEEHKFKLWYCTSLSGDPFGDEGMVMCYAESTDCSHWEKPLHPDCIPYEEQAATNIVLEDSGHHISLARNHDQRDPARKYLLAYNPGSKAKAAGTGPISTFAISADGRRWSTANENTPLPAPSFPTPFMGRVHPAVDLLQPVFAPLEFFAPKMPDRPPGQRRLYPLVAQRSRAVRRLGPQPAAPYRIPRYVGTQNRRPLHRHYDRVRRRAAVVRAR
jgi:hypothetical protein